jgi:hypothetical protein
LGAASHIEPRDGACPGGCAARRGDDQALGPGYSEMLVSGGPTPRGSRPRRSADLSWRGEGEEASEQLRDALRFVVMHPMRRVGQALDMVQVGYVIVVWFG